MEENKVKRSIKELIKKGDKKSASVSLFRDKNILYLKYNSS